MAPRAPLGNQNDPRQANLFDAGSATPASGSLQFDSEWRAALNRAIEECGFGRGNIAIEMERLLGNDPDYPVSVALINAWTAASKTDYRFPLIYLPAFVRATGADWLLDVLAGKCGRVTLTADEQRLVEIGRLTTRLRDDKRHLHRLVSSKGKVR
jgi:hypothetical protein